MKNSRLFQRDFTIMVAGQVISLFGNAILRFSLSLFVLERTGSAAVFGGILALSMIPTILLSPIGGVLADRLPRQRIMVALDFLTAALILSFDLLFARAGNLAAITVLMMALALIQAFYQPSVQASIPSLASPENLMRANGVVIQVQALAALLGPVIGGFLYAFLGLFPILLASAACFFLSAVMELFLRIPFLARKSDSSAWNKIISDLSEAARFLTHENPRLLRLLVIIAGLNLFLSALIIIGLPFLVKIHLGLSDGLYGIAEASMGLGLILGGLLSGAAARKIGFRQAHLFLLGTTLALAPIVLLLAFGAPRFVSYPVLLLCVVLGMGLSALFNIAAQTFIQKQTPQLLLGKVGAFISTICVCVLPIGQAMYGALFELFREIPWVVMLFGILVTLMLVLQTRRALRDVAR